MMEILNNQGTYTSSFDEAVITDILSQFKSGRVKGWLNELEVFQISSSTLGIKTGYAVVQGRVIRNKEDISINNAVLPSALTLKHIIIKIVIIDELHSTVEPINRDYESLIQEDIKKNTYGTYEIELARYYINSNGITDLILTLPLIPIINKDDLTNLIGPQGKSAYQIWLDLGNEGSAQDFINAITGPTGPQGLSSVGKSVYETWLDLGNEGSAQDFINAITGPTGLTGNDGKSAYQIWLDQGHIGSEEDFFDSISGNLLLEKLKLGKIIKLNDNFSTGLVNKAYYSNDYFICTDDSGIVKIAYLSPYQWTTQNVNINEKNIYDLAFLNNIWFAVGQSGRLSYLNASSPIGVWTVKTTGFNTYAINSIDYGNGLFVIAGSSAKLAKTTSMHDDFVLINVDFDFNYNDINKVIFGNGNWVIAGNGGYCSVSQDGGNTWGRILDMPSASKFNGNNIVCGCYANGLFVIAGYGGKLATSPNGVIWTMRDSSFDSSNITDLIYANGIFIAAGAGGKIAISSDGISWIQRKTFTHAYANQRLSYGNGYTVIMTGYKLYTALASIF